MSAYVVDRDHIRYLVEAALQLAEIPPHSRFYFGELRVVRDDQFAGAEGEISATGLGQCLWDENIKSVMARYPGSERDNLPGPVDEDFIYRHEDSLFHRVEVLRVFSAVACFEYQACEHAEWEGSTVRKFCEMLRAWWIYQIPGYRAARDKPLALPPASLSIVRIV